MKHLIPFRIYEAQTTSGLTPDQEAFLNKYTRGTWSVNPTTGLVDVQGNLYCGEEYIESLSGISFGHVSGDFNCYDNQLTSLEGSPHTVGGSFNCMENLLTSLAGAPQTVSGGFYCSNNRLTSLEGAPQTVGGIFVSNLIKLEKGKWNLEGWLEVLDTGSEEAKKLILTLPYLQPDWWNLELQRDPGKTIHLLSTMWNHMPKDFQSAIKIPKGYEGDFELFSGFDELGLF